MIRPLINRVGQRFGHYEVTEFLGRGGFADVFLGINVNLPPDKVAIKVLDKELIKEKTQQFRNEAAIILSLRHPHIIHFITYDIHLNPDNSLTPYPYIMMEYAAKGSLRSNHPRGTPLPVETIVTYVQQIASALGYAHGSQVMHLDVKPENILVNNEGELLLSDFGLAALVTEQEKANDVAGTLSYMAPEQLNGRPDKASDQYALGVMVYEWFCGKLPFRGRTVQEHIYKIMKDSPPSLISQVPTLSPAIEAVIMRAMSKNVRERYASVLQFAEELKKAINQQESVVVINSNNSNGINAPVAEPLPQEKSAGTLSEQQLPTFLTADNRAGRFSGSPIPVPAQSSNASPHANQANQGGMMPDPQANQGGAIPDPQANQEGMMPDPQANQGEAIPDPQANQGGMMPDPQANQGGAMPNSQVNQGGMMPDSQSQSPFLGGMPPGSQMGGVAHQQMPLQLPDLAAQMNQAGAAQSLQSPFLDGRPQDNHAGFIPAYAAKTVAAGAGPAQGGTPFLGASSPVEQQPVGAGVIFGPVPGNIFDQGMTVPASPPSLPPYLGRPGSGMSDYSGIQTSVPIGHMVREFFQPRRHRGLPLLFTTGIILNFLGSIFIGVWLSRVWPTPGNETAWLGMIASIICSIGGFWLFDYSGNKLLNLVLSFVLAIVWGFIGFAFAMVIGAGTTIAWLPDYNIMSLIFFVGSLVLHIRLTFRRA